MSNCTAINSAEEAPPSPKRRAPAQPDNPIENWKWNCQTMSLAAPAPAARAQ